MFQCLVCKQNVEWRYGPAVKPEDYESCKRCGRHVSLCVLDSSHASTVVHAGSIPVSESSEIAQTVEHSVEARGVGGATPSLRTSEGL